MNPYNINWVVRHITTKLTGQQNGIIGWSVVKTRNDHLLPTVHSVMLTKQIWHY